MSKSQILKGLLEGCILEIISRNETYGYEITQELTSNGFEFLNEASVYTVLMRLTKKGLITGVTKKSDKGPKRKYFSITTDGLSHLQLFKSDWNHVSKHVSEIIKGVDENE